MRRIADAVPTRMVPRTQLFQPDLGQRETQMPAIRHEMQTTVTDQSGFKDRNVHAGLGQAASGLQTCDTGSNENCRGGRILFGLTKALPVQIQPGRESEGFLFMT